MVEFTREEKREGSERCLEARKLSGAGTAPSVPNTREREMPEGHDRTLTLPGPGSCFLKLHMSLH